MDQPTRCHPERSAKRVVEGPAVCVGRRVHAFEDTWEWNLDAERSYQYIMETIGGRVADAMRAFRTFLSNSDMMAYLATMSDYQQKLSS